MKLKDCKLGTVVITEDSRVGHITGFVYNVHIRHTGNMSNEEKLDATIPIVKFPDDEYGIHHHNLKILK